MKRLIMLLCLTATLPACTTQNWYQGMQNSSAAQCSQAPNDDERQRCLQRTNSMSYDQYQRARQGQNP